MTKSNPASPGREKLIMFESVFHGIRSEWCFSDENFFDPPETLLKLERPENLTQSLFDILVFTL